MWKRMSSRSYLSGRWALCNRCWCMLRLWYMRRRLPNRSYSSSRIISVLLYCSNLTKTKIAVLQSSDWGRQFFIMLFCVFFWTFSPGLLPLLFLQAVCFVWLHPDCDTVFLPLSSSGVPDWSASPWFSEIQESCCPFPVKFPEALPYCFRLPAQYRQFSDAVIWLPEVPVLFS